MSRKFECFATRMVYRPIEQTATFFVTAETKEEAREKATDVLERADYFKALWQDQDCSEYEFDQDAGEPEVELTEQNRVGELVELLSGWTPAEVYAAAEAWGALRGLAAVAEAIRRNGSPETEV